MPDLYLHVGHHKTGSSFIQSALAGSISRLSGCGISYPVPPDCDGVAMGETSEGNGKLLLDHLENSDPEAPAWKCEGESLFFSRESFFFELLSEGIQERLKAFCEVSGFDSLRILLFTRNPVAHATSFYLQEVKGSGLTTAIEDFFETYDFPFRVERFLDAFSTARITVCNYSASKDRLLQTVAAWLGIPPATLNVPSRSMVNRSITRFELEFIRALNTVLGASSNFLASPLSNSLIDGPGEDLRPGLDTQEAFWKRMEPVVSRLNARLDPEGRYCSDVAPPVCLDSSALSISREQIQILAQNIGQKIASEQALAVAAEARAQNLRLKLKQRSGRMDDKIRALRLKLVSDPENVPALIRLARLLLRSDPLSKEARELFEKATALKPDGKAVRDLRSRLNRADLPKNSPEGERTASPGDRQVVG